MKQRTKNKIKKHALYVVTVIAIIQAIIFYVAVLLSVLAVI